MNLGENNEYATFAFYDKRGRRLSIFGQDLQNKSMLVTIIPCSTADKFSKKVGRDLFKQEKLRRETKIPYEKQPICFFIALKDSDKPGWSFIEFCKNNFLKKYTTHVAVQISYLA